MMFEAKPGLWYVLMLKLIVPSIWSTTDNFGKSEKKTYYLDLEMRVSTRQRLIFIRRHRLTSLSSPHIPSFPVTHLFCDQILKQVSSAPSYTQLMQRPMTAKMGEMQSSSTLSGEKECTLDLESIEAAIATDETWLPLRTKITTFVSLLQSATKGNGNCYCRTTFTHYIQIYGEAN